MADFGVCDCSGSLIPVWFTEEETKVANGTMYKTGRVRRACSHLVCEDCLKNFALTIPLTGRGTIGGDLIER